MENKGKSEPYSSFVVVPLFSLSFGVLYASSYIRPRIHSVPCTFVYVCSFSKCFFFIHTYEKNEIGLYKLKLVLDGGFAEYGDFWSTGVLLPYVFLVCSFVSLLFSLVRDVYVWSLVVCWASHAEWASERENGRIKRTPFKCYVVVVAFSSIVCCLRILSLRFLCTIFFFTHIVLHGSDCDMYIHGCMAWHGMVSRTTVCVCLFLLVLHCGF